MKLFARRKFLKRSTLAAGAIGSGVLASACNTETPQKTLHTPAITSTRTYEWRIVTTWPPNFPVLGEAVVKIAKDLEVMSAGRLKLKVYGAGELVPALEVFDAVTQGAVQMAHGVAYYWAGKIPAAMFFGAVPFGFNAQQMNAWLYYGGGLSLWEELYGKFGLLPLPCGNTGVQMGGWFNREINQIEDFKGIKMRIPGLGGKVLSKAGGAAVTVAGGEIYTNLERGVIDATEWIGPYHDYTMGFHKVAKYYYYPGWHEPGPTLEMFANKKAFEELPADLQEMVRTVSAKYNMLVLSEFEAKNNFYLQKILQESDVQLKKFPEPVLNALKQYAHEVLEEITETDPFSKKVYDNLRQFKKQISSWNATSERAMAPHL